MASTFADRLMVGDMMDNLLTLPLDMVTSDMGDAGEPQSCWVPPGPAEVEILSPLALVSGEIGQCQRLGREQRAS